MSTLIQDLRFHFRLWSRNPVLTASIVLTLALGIGASTTIFSVVHGVLLKPLPFAEPDRIVTLWETHPKQSPGFRVASLEATAAWASELEPLESIAASQLWRPVLARGSDLVGLTGARVSSEFFPILGVEPFLGRSFTARDANPEAPKVVILSYDLWQTRFGSSREIIGTQITIEGSANSAAATIIGILPPDLNVGEPLVFEPPEIWAPLDIDPNPKMLGRRYLQVVGRLHPDATIEQARGQLAAISERLEGLAPETNRDWQGAIEGLSEQLVAPVRPALWLLLAAGGLVFFVACCNVGVALLSQATTRRQELAVRLAIGATPTRVGQLVLSECLLTALVSSLLGYLFAHAGLALVMRHAFATLPRRSEIALDFEALAFSLILALVTAVVFSLLPILRVASPQNHLALRQSRASSKSGGRRGGRLRQSLVLAEIALSLILVITAALMMQSFGSLTTADPGFDHHEVLTLRLQLPKSLYPDKQSLNHIYRRIKETIASLPETHEIGLVSHVPMSGSNMSTLAAAASAPDSPLHIELRGASEGYFATLSVPVLSGRDFEVTDLSATQAVAIVSRSTARRLWPDQDALGKMVRVDWGPTPERRVVGVVGDVHHHGVSAEIQPTVYLPFVQLPHRAMTLVIRSQSPHALIGDLRARLEQLGEHVVVDEIDALTQVVASTIEEPRSRALLSSVFALITLLLAAGGTYSVVTFSVNQRRFDFSVRQALGAKPWQLARDTLSIGLKQAIFGVVIGLTGSILIGGALTKVLYGISGFDFWTMIGATLAMLLVTLIASFVPACRVLKVDPASALRSS